MPMSSYTFSAPECVAVALSRQVLPELLASEDILRLEEISSQRAMAPPSSQIEMISCAAEFQRRHGALDWGRIRACRTLLPADRGCVLGSTSRPGITCGSSLFDAGAASGALSSHSLRSCYGALPGWTRTPFPLSCLGRSSWLRDSIG